MSARTINAILTHLPPSEVRAMVSWWDKEMSGCETLVVYGGRRESFEELEVPESVFVEGDRHCTKDHQRERQGYSAAMSAVAAWLEGRDYRYVNFLEYDVLPLVSDWPEKLEVAIEEEGAGMLCHDLQRIDGTNDAHFLNHSHDSAFGEHWESISVRADPSVVFSSLGAHTFWQREAFEAVASCPEPVPIYLELNMPTAAHHLGFRVRPVPDAEGFMRPLGDFSESEIAAARAGGAGAVHPVKGGAW